MIEQRNVGGMNVGRGGRGGDGDMRYDFSLKMEMKRGGGGGGMRGGRKGFLNGMLTRQIGGSVIPINGVILVEMGNDLNIYGEDLRKC